MVDTGLASEVSTGPLRYLFLDLNAYFASVEQQEETALRGRPVAVVPVMADSSFVIAASYEAKRFGVKTGTRIGEARRMCPDLQLVHARPPLYVHYHQRVIAAVESVLHVDRVCSIDEMECRLMGEERTREAALAMAGRVKQAICENAGEYLRCSIGIAQNGFLAKVATDMQKPDGLVILEGKDLPHALFGLQLTDFAGINRRMKARLQGAGIFTAEAMCRASRAELKAAFGSVVGERWWYLLRGHDLPHQESARKSLSHSHVMAPELRHDQGAREVLWRLIQKAAARLRANGLAAKRMSIGISGRVSWEAAITFPASNDSVEFTRHAALEWERRSFEGPLKAWVVFGDLVSADAIVPSLFDQTVERQALNAAIDSVNQKFGKNSIYLASVEGAKQAAPERIAFNKTWLFSEGKDDNEWVDTFRGLTTSED